MSTAMLTLLLAVPPAFWAWVGMLTLGFMGRPVGYLEAFTVALVGWCGVLGLGLSLSERP